MTGFPLLFTPIHGVKRLLVGKGDVSLDTTVIQCIRLSARPQIAEEIPQPDNASGPEPYRRHAGHGAGNKEVADGKIPVPPFIAPRAELIPDGNAEKAQRKIVTETEEKDAPRECLAALRVFRRNADDVGEDGPGRPTHLELASLPKSVLAPMQHSVQIERHFAGQEGDGNVEQNAQHRKEKVELDGVDGPPYGIHLPMDVRLERRRKPPQRTVEGFNEIGLGNGRIYFIRPAALDVEIGTAQGNAGAQRSPRTRRCAEAAVKTEGHNGPGAANPHRAGQRIEHLTGVQLLHPVGACEKEEADAD